MYFIYIKLLFVDLLLIIVVKRYEVVIVEMSLALMSRT